MIRNPDAYDKTRVTWIERLKNWDDQRSWKDFFDTSWKLISNSAEKRD